jgi:ATP-binding cassette subfamily C protein
MLYLRTFSDLPRLLIEGLVMGSVLLVVGFMLLLKQDMQTLIPTLGLFAMAAVRLMPSMNRILSGLTSARYYSASVNNIYHDLKELENVPSSPNERVVSESFSFNQSIKLENISFRYHGAEKDSLKDVSLTILKGQSIAFVGPSGAGKTTIVDALLGLLEPGSGRVLVDGVNINTNLAGWQQKIGYIPQPIYLSDDTIKRNVAFGVEDDKIDDEQVWTALRAAQLEDFIVSLPDKLDTLVGEHGVRISGGQRQRIGIARALYHNPEILVLDEATAALDNETESEVTKAIEALSGTKTIIAIAHRLTTVRNFDCLFFMKDGKIVDAANFENLLQNNIDFQKMAKPVSFSDSRAGIIG